VRIVKTAWTNDAFCFEGEYWTFPPRDVVQPHSAYLKFGKGVEAAGRVTKIEIAPRPFQKPIRRFVALSHTACALVEASSTDAGAPAWLQVSTPPNSADGRAMVRYDNEAGKGDHRHINGHEERYNFRSVEVLVDDFLRDIDQARKGRNP
jgi:hypothetical protein